ncbi:FHA domain-containing protein [Acidobacteriota bacterium]
MKKKIYLVSLIGLIVSSLILIAQAPPVPDAEIENFDNMVAQMDPIPRQIDISLDLVGLEIQGGSDAEDQLTKVAEAGGGRYFPVANAADLSQIFNQVTTGIGGGGGGMVTRAYSTFNWPLAIGLLLVFGSIILMVAMIVMRLRSTAGPTAVPAAAYATFHITYQDGGTKSIPVTSHHLIFGRNMDTQVVLHDPDVSKNHAELVITQEGYLLRDLGSTNGTSINGVKITEQYLYLNDEITMGTTTLIFGE